MMNASSLQATDTPDNTSSSLSPQKVIHPQLELSRNLWIYLSPIMIVLGTCGNIMTIFVLRRKSMWKMSSSPYLVVLAVTDIIVLYTGLLRQWLRYMIDMDIRQLSPILCKFHLFAVYGSLDFSVWILVAVSVERFICVCFPFKAKSLCTRRKAYIAMSLIFVALALLNSHFFYGYVSEFRNGEETAYSHCSHINDDYATFVDEIWPWIDLSVFSMIPFCLIFVCNISLITRILRRKKVGQSEDGAQRRGNPSSMTALLVSLNTVFLVTTAPVCIYLIGYPYWAESASPDQEVQLILWYAIVSVLMYLNNSVNFVFYCVSGPRFRRELKAIFGGVGRDEGAMTMAQTDVSSVHPVTPNPTQLTPNPQTPSVSAETDV